MNASGESSRPIDRELTFVKEELRAHASTVTRYGIKVHIVVEQTNLQDFHIVLAVTFQNFQRQKKRAKTVCKHPLGDPTADILIISGIGIGISEASKRVPITSMLPWETSK